MKTIKTSIIPHAPIVVKTKGPHELDKRAICVFVATGFFLDTDTYWKDHVALPPASMNELDDQGVLQKSTPWFQWHHTPRTLSFEDALNEFTTLFEAIITEQVGNKKVILPLSGGLDSRSQAVALEKLDKDVAAYSYDFKGGYPETKIAKKIASICNFDFKEYSIGKGYLWDKIQELGRINQCYSEFTHPRQMAIFDTYEPMGQVFSLGHWGDVLFDKGAPEGIKEKELPKLILKKVIKKGGLELANALWTNWKLEGSFESYLQERIQKLLDAIEIDHVGAKMRAFKSLYWAPRWTSTNLAVFSEVHPITLPYYDDRMCQFICSLPEEYLADRKLQIAYMKKRNPALAKVTWQDHKPYNLYTYTQNKSPQNLPYRIGNKLRREGKALLGSPYIQRNWELQFLGEENKKALEGYLFGNHLSKLVDEDVTKELYQKFTTQDQVYYSHPVSMLLTLAVKMEQLSSE